MFKDSQRIQEESRKEQSRLSAYISKCRTGILTVQGMIEFNFDSLSAFSRYLSMLINLVAFDAIWCQIDSHKRACKSFFLPISSNSVSYLRFLQLVYPASRFKGPPKGGPRHPDGLSRYSEEGAGFGVQALFREASTRLTALR